MRESLLIKSNCTFFLRNSFVVKANSFFSRKSCGVARIVGREEDNPGCETLSLLKMKYVKLFGAQRRAFCHAAFAETSELN